jgi:hypothetical protein
LRVLILPFLKISLTLSKIIKMEQIIQEEVKPVAIDPDSPMAQGLLRMLQHKKLREQFWFGEITFEELNKQLLEKGINKQYEHPAAV